METKKKGRNNLENKRGLFLQIGIFSTILLAYLIINWGFKNVEINDSNTELYGISIEIESYVKYKKLIPPPPTNSSAEKLIIIGNDEIPVNETEPMDVEIAHIIKIDEIKEIDEVDYFPSPTSYPTQAEFPGGEEGLKKYIRMHLDYPVQAREDDIQGKIYVRFLVNTKGKVEQVQLINKVHPLLDKEALRVVNGLPKWKPGKLNGRNISMWYTIPINFVLK